MLNGLLPIGSVVLLKNSSKRVMVIGVCQKQSSAEELVVWDYAGCLYPEGYISPDKTYMFNNEQIEKIYALGYQDEEQFTFKVKADAVLKRFRAEEAEKRI